MTGLMGTSIKDMPVFGCTATVSTVVTVKVLTMTVTLSVTVFVHVYTSNFAL